MFPRSHAKPTESSPQLCGSLLEQVIPWFLSILREGRLHTDIAVDGQQAAGVVLDGKLLDGRSRRGVCELLGLPLEVGDYLGTEAQVLIHVLSASTYHRELSAAQRACVAATVLPRISEETAAGRLRKYRETVAKRQGEDCLANLPNNSGDEDGTVSARLTVARMMRGPATGMSTTRGAKGPR